VSWPDGPVTVAVPATSANLGPGFDSFGLALSLHDTVTARVTPAGVAIEVTGAGAAAAAAGEQHLVIKAMRAAFAQLGAQPPGISLMCHNEIPQGFGLGSSAGAIVAGLLAARALAGGAGLAVLPDDALFALATSLEGHPDNVAACLAGGLTIAWTPGPGPEVRVARLTPLPAVRPVLCVPAAPLATEAARKVLPAQVPHADAAANSARAALLVIALTSQPGLLLDATQDFLHQRYRAAAMPATSALIGALRAAGVPAVISGAGPSVLAFTVCGAGPTAADVATVAGTAAWRVLPLPVDTSGATVHAGARSPGCPLKVIRPRADLSNKADITAIAI
jgi:homoserine kinase